MSKKQIINLGVHPFADTFISKEQQGNSEPIYPLVCYQDKETGLVKLKYKTKPSDRYNLYDYSYTSSNSSFSRNYWQSYAIEVSKKLNINKSIKIVEIGSNDGYLAKQFQKKGHNVLGIDSSSYISEIANKSGINTHCGIFNKKLSKHIKEGYGSMDLIIANNVFNHANDPLDFAYGIKNLLSPEGTFVFEVPYWYNTIVDERFDQIYHEHVSYFTVLASVNLLKKVGLTVYDVDLVDYHGGSIRVYSKINPSKISSKVSDFITKEKSEGLFEQQRYNIFMNKIKNKRNLFLKKIYTLLENKKHIVGVGAAAKGNTFLNFYNLDNTIIDYITDTSEHKIGKYTPLTRIPIVEDKILAKYDEVYVIILSWNISDMIKDKLKSINNNITFLELN